MRGFRVSALWSLYLELALPLICVGGSTLFPYTLRFPLICLTGILALVVIALEYKLVYFHIPSASMLLVIGYMAVQLLYSYDRSTTLRLFTIYAASSLLLSLNIEEACMQRIVRNMQVICVIIAISIVLSSLVDNCMLKYFSWVVNPNGSPSVAEAIRKELASGAYSGFAREKGEAAQIMNIGIAIGYARYFADGRLDKKNTLCLLLCLTALLLTGKRMMLVIAAVNFAGLLLISRTHGKVFKLAGIGMLALLVLTIIFMFVPVLGNVLYRFLDTDNLAAMGNRDSLWRYLAMMLSEYWLFGAGFGAYNAFAFDHGLRVYKAKWSYHGHNSYYQGLCELGVAGSIPYLFFLGSSLFTVIRFVRRDAFPTETKRLLYFGCYVVMMYMIYALTGNPAYTAQYIVQLFFSVGMVLCLGRKYLTPVARRRM